MVSLGSAEHTHTPPHLFRISCPPPHQLLCGGNKQRTPLPGECDMPTVAGARSFSRFIGIRERACERVHTPRVCVCPSPSSRVRSLSLSRSSIADESDVVKQFASLLFVIAARGWVFPHPPTTNHFRRDFVW